MPGKLQLFQLSTLPSRHPSLIWPFAKMETVKRMVLSQWSLLDTCMCALCWVLVIDVNWIVEKMSHQMASLPRHWTRASACSSKIQKFVQCSAHSCSNWNRQRDSWQRQDSWKPEHSSISNQRLFLTQGLRYLENSSFFSFQHCQGDTLHWSAVSQGIRP